MQIGHDRKNLYASIELNVLSGAFIFSVFVLIFAAILFTASPTWNVV